MTDPPAVSISVALCTHNGAAHVAEQVASILAQQPPPDELVVGDDASTDSTVAIIERLVAERQDSGSVSVPRLIVVRRDPALGVVRNVEETIAVCSGDLIALSDQDDVWHAGKLAALAAQFAADPQLLLAHTDARLVDGDGRPLGLTLLDALEATVAERRGLAAGDALAVLLRRNLVTGATVVFRRELRDAATPFPPDWVHDEWLAAIAASVGRVRLVPRPLIDYRQHGGNQIGARRPTMADRLARLREPRAARAARLERRARFLAERVVALDAPEAAQTAVHAKLAHESARARLPRVRAARLPGVLAGALTGRYGRYSRGAMDVVRDLAQPPGPRADKPRAAPSHVAGSRENGEAPA